MSLVVFRRGKVRGRVGGPEEGTGPQRPRKGVLKSTGGVNVPPCSRFLGVLTLTIPSRVGGGVR